MTPPPVTPPTTDPNLQPVNALWTCAPGAVAQSPGRIVRLSAAQFENSVKALAGGAMPAGFINPFKGEETKSRFQSYAEGLRLPTTLAEGVFGAAEATSRAMAPLVRTEFTCLAGAADAACAQDAIGKLATRIFRRPVEADERTRLANYFTAQSTKYGKDAALDLTLRALLVSPSFLFRTELGDGTLDASRRTRLTGFEVASALAYTVTDAPPDAVLLQAAEKGELGNAAGIAAQVERMFGKIEDSATVARFLREYLRFPEAVAVAKDQKLYPGHSASGLISDTEAFVRDAVAQRRDFIGALLNSRVGFVRGATTSSYGLKLDAKAAVQKVELPMAERSGYLTQPSFLVAFSQTDHTDPILRGKFVREALLCQAIPPLPIGLVVQLPDGGPTITMRDRLAEHSKREECAVCHRLMDPIGLALESFDHVGRFRATEANKAVDVSGAINGVDPSVDGPFMGHIELAQRLARAPLTRQCFVRQAFRYWMGRDEGGADACSLRAADTAFQGGDPMKLFAAILASDSFLFRSKP